MMTLPAALYMNPVLLVLELVWLVGLGVFLAGYLSESVLYLLEDRRT